MLLSELKTLLAAQPERVLRLVLPTGSQLPPHAHITEIALLQKQFIDCGGTFRTENSVRMQAWFADDTEHRLTAGKLLGILGKSSSFLQRDDLEVEVECEAPFIAHFPIEKAEPEADLLLLRLGVRHTACLAEDRCLPPRLPKPLPPALPSFKPGKCC